MSEWLHINPDLFHFLRPEWLWLFIPVALIVLVSLLLNRSKKGWQKSIAAHLRPYVIGKGSRFSTLGPLVLYLVASSLMIIAAAGPTWEKIDVPGTKSEAILLIALDLSSSMLVEDVSPNRLERAKFKVRDLLDADPGSQVGLLVYAGTAHPVVTPCKDYELVKYQLETLAPGIMPLQGSQLEQALKMADTIFSRTEAPSTLLLMTDVVDSEEAKLLTDFVGKSNDKLELMTFATPNGGKIPAYRKGNYFKEKGEFVISKLDQNILFGLQKDPSINVNPLTLDKTDVEEIAAKVKKNLVFRSMDEESEEDWKEMGFALLWIVVVIYALWFRRGWMIQSCLLLVVLSSCSTKVESWDDLWYTPDYQGQQSMNQEDFELAADQFTSLTHKGIAYYKAGDYESAIQLFSQDSSAVSMFNLGLAYAANGQNELAEEALLLASELDPENERIQGSLEKNKEAIRQIDSLRTANPEAAIALEEKKEKKGNLKERKGKGKDEELSSDTEVKELPKDGDRITDEVDSGIRKAEEMEKPPENFVPEKGESAQNVLLREISADPSEFLRRRFKYQYDKHLKDTPKPAKPW